MKRNGKKKSEIMLISYHLRLPFPFFFLSFSVFFLPSLAMSPFFAFALLIIIHFHICWYTLWHRCIDETNLLRTTTNKNEKEFVIRTNTQAPSTLISIYRASSNNNNTNVNGFAFSLSSILFFHSSGGTKTNRVHTHYVGHKQKNLFDNEQRM